MTDNQSYIILDFIIWPISTIYFSSDVVIVEKACDRIRLIVLNKGEIDPTNLNSSKTQTIKRVIPISNSSDYNLDNVK